MSAGIDSTVPSAPTMPTSLGDLFDRFHELAVCASDMERWWALRGVDADPSETLGDIPVGGADAGTGS